MARARKIHKHKDSRHVFYAGKEAKRYGLPVIPDVALKTGEAGPFAQNFAFSITGGGRAVKRAARRLKVEDQ